MNGGRGCCFQVCESTSTRKSLPARITDAQLNTFRQRCQFFSCKSQNKCPFNYIVHTFLWGCFEFRVPWKRLLSLWWSHVVFEPAVNIFMSGLPHQGLYSFCDWFTCILFYQSPWSRLSLTDFVVFRFYYELSRLCSPPTFRNMCSFVCYCTSLMTSAGTCLTFMTKLWGLIKLSNLI